MAPQFMANFYFSTTKNSAFLTSKKVVEGRKTRSRLLIERLERAITVEEGSLADLAKDYASHGSLPYIFDS